MQFLKVLRGCLAAYAAGVIVIFAGMLIFGGAGIEVLLAIAVFGLFALVPFVVIALVMWSAMAQAQTQVQAVHATAICAGVFFFFAAVGALIDGELPAVLVIVMFSPLVGAAFGAVFWIGAFGFKPSITMGWRMPQEP